jgi:hypothetical protein
VAFQLEEHLVGQTLGFSLSMGEVPMHV